MPVKRHDWIKYKQDYFESPIDEIKKFFRSYSEVVPQKTFEKQTSGWYEEKQEFKKRQAEAARAKLANDPDVKDMTARLLKAKENILTIMMYKLAKEKDELCMKDLSIGLNMAKLELGEPLVISDNKNKIEGNLDVNVFDKLKLLNNEELMQLTDIAQKLESI